MLAGDDSGLKASSRLLSGSEEGCDCLFLHCFSRDLVSEHVLCTYRLKLYAPEAIFVFFSQGQENFFQALQDFDQVITAWQH